MSRSRARGERGFSLIELMLVVGVVLVLAAISVPRMVTTASDMSLRLTASDFSGMLQTARIQAVRRNTFFTVLQGTLPDGTQAYFVDLPKSGVYANGDPIIPVNPGVTFRPGIGSGAPNEGALIASLNFTVNPGGNPISFNARGLPCVVAAAACPETPGQGFVMFMSKPAIMGNTPWTAVVITPSGHMQLWTDDSNGNWTPRD